MICLSLYFFCLQQFYRVQQFVTFFFISEFLKNPTFCFFHLKQQSVKSVYLIGYKSANM